MGRGKLVDHRDATDMFNKMRRRNLIESGKYTEEEVDLHPEEWVWEKGSLVSSILFLEAKSED